MQNRGFNGGGIYSFHGTARISSVQAYPFITMHYRQNQIKPAVRKG
jgi:hypothetical protein